MERIERKRSDSPIIDAMFSARAERWDNSPDDLVAMVEELTEVITWAERVASYIKSHLANEEKRVLIAKLRALANDPRAPEGERDTARRMADKIEAPLRYLTP